MKPSHLIKRIRLARHQKLLLCQAAEDFPSYTCAELARWAKSTFNLPASLNMSTVSRIIRGHAALQRQPDSDDRKKRLQPAHALVDQNVVEFVLQAEAEGICINGAMIIFFATEVCEKLAIPRHLRPRIGPSWLRCLQERYGFRWRRAYGESSTVDLDKAKEQLDRVRAAIRMYPPRNVFNMDESALFHNAVPRGSICKGAAPTLKQSKARVTMVCCTNADGSGNLPLLFLGTAAKPRWYSRKPEAMQYMGTPKGWMTTWMYQQWLDEQMTAEDRHILLLVDNASSHDETGLTLIHIRVENCLQTQPPRSSQWIKALYIV